MTSARASAAGLLVLWAIPFLQAVAQPERDVTSTIAPVPPFRSVELRNGGTVTLRYAPTQRVTVLNATPDDELITMASGDVLVINRCERTCPRRHRVEVEILTPAVAHLTVAHGGTIQSLGSFPRQAALAVTVDNGGRIDIRSMSVASITASVISGGGILLTPLTELVARVEDGGYITYWGDPRVTQSVEHAGVVVRGRPADADKPLSELGPGAVEPAHSILPVRPKP
jgi:hypothetical protein